ncbi:hypothetical protein OC834_001415 [Tilletia horrida]|nr:hypothetical protein OC834_001415 [Tilletia horrida]
MSRLDGVIILGPDGRALIQSHFRSSDALPLSHIDHLNHAASGAANAAAAASSSSALTSVGAGPSSSATAASASPLASAARAAQLRPLLWVPGVPPPPLTHPDASSDDEEDNSASSRRAGKQRELDWQDALAEQGAALAHIEHGGLKFLCPVSAEINPLLPLTFLRALLSLLAIYAGGLSNVNEHSVREHFDVVYQLLEETLDDGWPLFTEPNALQDLIITQSWLDRVTKVVNATGLTSVPSPQANELSSIPWRRANVYHRSQEFYADAIDSLEGTFDAQGRPLILELFARIACRSKLSANPELTLTLSGAHSNSLSVLNDPILHPCVRHRKWTKDRIFSFVPPDGSFELANFRVGDPLSLPLGSIHASARKAKSGLIQLPSGGNGWERDVPILLKSFFEVKPVDAAPTQGRDRDRDRGSAASSSGAHAHQQHARHGVQVEFSLTVQSRLPPNLPIENIVVSVALGPGAHSVDAAASGGGVGQGASDGSSPLPVSLQSATSGASALKTVTDALSTTVAALGSAAVVHPGGKAGAWVFDQGACVLRWELPKLGSGADRPAVLKGSFVTLDSPPRIAPAVRTTFAVPNHSLSNVRVGSVQIAGEGPTLKVFKGIRSVVEGDLEWRRF